MAGRKAGTKQAPAKIEEDDDAEGWDDAVVDAEDKEEADLRLRDWRDVERYREMKELRRLVDDDYGLEEIFHIPLKPRAEPAIPAPRVAAKLLKVAPAAAAAIAKPAAKAAKVAPKEAARPAKAAPPPKATPHKAPPARLKAKAKRR